MIHAEPVHQIQCHSKAVSDGGDHFDLNHGQINTYICENAEIVHSIGFYVLALFLKLVWGPMEKLHNLIA